jgi:hypothetical protein
MSDPQRASFLRNVSAWLCRGYFLDIRYLALATETGDELLGAVVGLSPTAPSEDVSFELKVAKLKAGQIQMAAPDSAFDVLREACEGTLAINGLRLPLSRRGAIGYYSDNSDPRKPGVDFHLRIQADRPSTLAGHEVLDLDTGLRRATPPFDGLTDLCGWLGVDNPSHHGRASQIDVRVNPPVDLLFESKLEDDTLHLKLRALGSFDARDLQLAVRVAPGAGLSRYLLGDKIEWAESKNGMKEGEVVLRSLKADLAQCMLTLGDFTVRRHIFVDRNRARTLRLAAFQSHDSGLEQLRSALQVTKIRDRDAARFEKGIASLLFLYGFAATPHVDTDAPDLLVTTPGGRIAVVECTVSVSDFYGKVSKLAARRNKLLEDLSARGHAADVHAVLVCASPRDEIMAADDIELAKNRVTLLTREHLMQAIEEVQRPPDPDELLARADAALAKSQRSAQGV